MTLTQSPIIKFLVTRLIHKTGLQKWVLIEIPELGRGQAVKFSFQSMRQ